jgi:hypothetical protein
MLGVSLVLGFWLFSLIAPRLQLRSVESVGMLYKPK